MRNESEIREQIKKNEEQMKSVNSEIRRLLQSEVRALKWVLGEF